MLNPFVGLTGKTLAGRACFVFLVLAGLSIGTVSFVKAAGWINKPFAGFLINQRMVINGMGQYSWTGMHAGLKYPDKILAANHQPLHTSQDLERVVLSAPVGQPISYMVGRGGRMVELDIPTMRFSPADFTVLVGTLFFAGLVYLVLGVSVFLLKPDSPVSWSHFLLCFALSAYNLTAFDVAATHTGFVRWYFAFTALVPAAAVHLSMLFPRPWPPAQRRPWLQAMPYLVAAAILMPMEVFYPGPVFLMMYNFLIVYLLIGALLVLSSSLAAYLWQSSVLARQRSKVVLFGAALAFPMPAFAELALSQGWTFQGMSVQANFLAIPLLFFPAAIAYAIAKHNLFDVDVYIKRTVGYVLMTLIVGAGYFSIQVIMRKVVLEPLFGAQAENVYPIVFALLVVFFFDPVNRRVQEAVGKLFFRKQYDFRSAVASVSDALTSVLDLNEICRQVIQTVRRELFVDAAGVVLVEDRKRECQSVFIADGAAKGQEEKKDLCIAYDDPLLALISREKKLITKYDIAEDPQYESVRDSCGKRFAEMGASLAIPLFSHDQVTGLMALGYKKSGHFYTREDVDLLKTVSSMTSTAIEQAREKGQKEVMRKLFEKHVSPEVAEAVWEQRELFLEGGRPKSQKLIVTVLFTDLKGFSTVSERMDPQGLMDWLNGYMDKMAKIVMNHGGIVDDYFGDAIKANFGVPLPRTTATEIRNDAVNAVNCALAMEQEMKLLNKAMLEQGLPTLRMRVGIYTGPVVAGSLGSSDRLKYTTIGDTVNTASRLESFDKDLVLPHLETSPCRILIGQSTLDYLGDQFLTLRVGELALKGKDEKIAAYGVIGRATQRAVISSWLL